MATRIATVTATGARYVVIALDFTTDKAMCFGELVSFRGQKRRYNGRQTFPLADVSIEYVSSVPADELLDQAIAARRAAGAVVRVSCRGNGKDFGTPLERARYRVLSAPLVAAMAGPAGLEDALLCLAEEAERKGLSGQVEAILEMI